MSGAAGDPLSDAEIAAEIAGLDGWRVADGWLTHSRTLDSFPAALAWVQPIGELAEAMNHHPEIDIRWRTVTLRVRTHDAGDQITALDLDFAHRVNQIG